MEKVANPLISVVIPVYNVQDYLDRCVESIAKQTYENLEVILVDDGSKDGSPKKCDEWAKKDNRITVIHKQNGGVSSARNAGIDKAKGEYISFVDSDDWLESNYFQEMLNILSNNNVEYITCGYKRVYEDGKIEEFNNDGSTLVIDSSEYIKEVLNVHPGYGFVHMKLVKKEVLNNIRFNESLKVGEDALFNTMICEKIEKVAIYNKPLYNYYFNPESVVRKYDAGYVDKYYKSMEEMKKYLLNKENIDLTYLYNYIAFHIMLICVNYCYHPDNKDNMKSLKEVCNIPLFKEAIKKSKIKRFASKSRQITLFTLKSKLYFLTAAICKIRQKQFKK